MKRKQVFQSKHFITLKYNTRIIYNLCFLPLFLLPPVTKFRGVFGGRKLFLPGHLGFIFEGRVEGFPQGEVARDVGAHVLPRGEGGHVVVVFYHKIEAHYFARFLLAICAPLEDR